MKKAALLFIIFSFLLAVAVFIPIEEHEESTMSETSTTTRTDTDYDTCIQVITPAIGPDGKCKEFPTPCDVPAGWKKVDECPAPTIK